MSDEVRVAVASAALLGESPVWHPRENALYYADIPGRRLQRFDPASGELRHWSFDADLASCAPRLDGSWLLAMRDGLWSFDPARAALYRFTRGKLTREVEGVTTLNGLAWSPNGRTIHWSDTKAHTIYAADFDPAAGTLSRRRVFASFPVKQPDQPLAGYGGRPDGAAMDAEGCYWVAMFEGQRVLRLSPEGEVLRVVELPVRCPTMPCFGGAGLKTLYVTTARQNRPAAELADQPFAGCVLALDVDVPGLPANFAL